MPANDFDTVSPIANSRLLRDQVKDVIKTLIIDGSLSAGTRLVETSLATKLLVSRQPVREALQSLAVEGWVDFQPRLGASVHRPTVREASEVFRVRIALEGLSAQSAAENITEEAIQALRGICERGRQAVIDNRPEVVASLNSEFHLHVARIADNETLLSSLVALDQKIRWYFRSIATIRGFESWDEHDKLVSLLSVGDSEAAASIMRTHVERSQLALDALGVSE